MLLIVLDYKLLLCQMKGNKQYKNWFIIYIFILWIVHIFLQATRSYFRRTISTCFVCAQLVDYLDDLIVHRYIDNLYLNYWVLHCITCICIHISTEVSNIMIIFFVQNGVPLTSYRDILFTNVPAGLFHKYRYEAFGGKYSHKQSFNCTQLLPMLSRQ